VSDWEGYPLDVEMTFLRQSIPAHRPGEGRVGDCYRTCIASLIGAKSPEDVPHFVEQRMANGDSNWDDLRRARLWLRERHEMDLLCVNLDYAVRHNLPFLITVQSNTGPWPHVVIGRGTGIIHDPSGFGLPYTLDDAQDAVVEILVTPYTPDPDEMVRQWAARHPEAVGA
jgi:hypothetical protein